MNTDWFFEKGVNTAATEGPGRLESEFKDFPKFSLRPVDMINVRIFSEHYGKFDGNRKI